MDLGHHVGLSPASASTVVVSTTVLHFVFVAVLSLSGQRLRSRHPPASSPRSSRCSVLRAGEPIHPSALAGVRDTNRVRERLEAAARTEEGHSTT